MSAHKLDVDRFDVEADYYNRNWGGREYPCRRTLEIFDRHCGRTGDPDAVVIMMNPGGSKPSKGVGDIGKGLVVAKPDLTQHRIKALMNERHWNWVRVLNLSDLRTPKSGEFREWISELQRNGCDDEHSIFSNRRRKDLQVGMKRASGAPVIAAWGCHSALKYLAESALSALNEIGVETPTGRVGRQGGWRYWHPLVRNKNLQDEWLREVCKKLGPSEGLIENEVI